jgi:uncharacterized protein DUF6402
VLLITDLPDIMEERENWPVAAALMRRWFAGEAVKVTASEKNGLVPMSTLPASMLDEQILTMTWALQFERVREAYQTLTTQKWHDPAAIRQLAVQLKRYMSSDGSQANKDGQGWRFGDLAQPAKIVAQTSQVNTITVGHVIGPLDDFYGAIGRGSLNVAITGKVSRLANGSLRIVIDALGVYLSDSYDFNGDQPLGVWTQNGLDRNLFDELIGSFTKGFPPIAVNADEAGTSGGADPKKRFAVSNAVFEGYRDLSGRGGDFIVVSDVKVMTLPKPQVFDLT